MDKTHIEESETLAVLSIDAWRAPEGGWNWNNWRRVGDAPREVLGYSKRKLLRFLRDEGYLSAASKGKVAVENDGYNLVVIERSNGMPLFAVEYGGY